MAKIEVALNPKQIREAFGQLNTNQKIKLVEEFEKETRRTRWDSVVKRIRQHAAKYPLSQKEITRICEEARQELYARKHKSNN